MNRDDIIRMAHLAGYIGSYADGGLGEQRFNFSKEQLIEFAKSVAAHEREACARVCENIEDYDETISDTYYSDHYANAIRARGEA